MANSEKEKPVYMFSPKTLLVYEFMWVGLVFGFDIFFFLTQLYGILIALVIPGITIVLAMLHWSRNKSRNGVLFYNDRFKIVNGGKIGLEIFYANVTITEIIQPPLVRRPAIVEIGTDTKDCLFTIPKTQKVKELGGHSLLDWLKTKIDSSSGITQS